MADLSAIKLPDGITYDIKDKTKQPLLVSGTNIKTINGTSILGSGDITVTASGTSIPTADEIAEFDSDAHINSTDMTTGSNSELEDFLSELNISGAELETTQSDWVVENGTDGIWTWQKWQSGIVDLWGVSTGSSEPYATTVQCGYWYSHRREIIFPFSIKNISGAYSVRCASGWAIPGSALVHSHDDSPSFTTSTYVYALSSTSGTITVTYKMIIKGRWK